MRAIPGVVAVLVAAGFLSACVEPDATVQASSPTAEERGAVLAAVGGCDDCHTPMAMTDKGPAPDLSRRFAGHPEGFEVGPPPALPEPWIWAGVGTNTAFAGPWGISYAVNITPDVETGIGSWSEQDFISAMRTGKHLGVGRPILPPMPWPGLSRLGDEDLAALFAFMKSVPAIRNRVPEPVLPSAPQG